MQVFFFCCFSGMMGIALEPIQNSIPEKEEKICGTINIDIIIRKKLYII